MSLHSRFRPDGMQYRNTLPPMSGTDPTQAFKRCCAMTSGTTVLRISRLLVNYLNRRFSRESWPIEVQPISFIPRSSSARIRPNARSTPA